MVKLSAVFLLLSATAALAQQDCPLCEPGSKLRTQLGQLDPGSEQHKSRGEDLSRDGVKLLLEFRDSIPPSKQGRKSFEALVNLSSYAAPFAPDALYEKELAAINRKSPDFRKQYQAMIRKGLRSRDRRQSCQFRYLQTNVTVQECMLQEREKGGTEDSAHRRCDASYALNQCLAKKWPAIY